ncbi:hypothetical protein [Salinarimonas soli]|uniref:Uncharacterized protein n=1 Tax=Salinarimonas soli TaxID=1638099 RepID=A0A5B2VHG1_9HYPH|nr:hypothetical protein [Salinarimonas soli]KAA2237920.1 hypothetical protein F0L46_07970 [Salinarimonas soli]
MTRRRLPRAFYVTLLSGMALHLFALVLRKDMPLRGALATVGLTLLAASVVLLWRAGRARADRRAGIRERWIRRRRGRYLKAE